MSRFLLGMGLVILASASEAGAATATAGAAVTVVPPAATVQVATANLAAAVESTGRISSETLLSSLEIVNHQRQKFTVDLTARREGLSATTPAANAREFAVTLHMN